MIQEKPKRDYNPGAFLKPQAYLYFFLNTLRSYVNIFNPSSVIVCWDYRNGDGENLRKIDFEDYKQNRVTNMEVFEYADILREMLDSLGVIQLYPRTLEADDIMYWLCAKKYPNDCILITADTDMYQLVNPELNENIVYNPLKKIQINNVYLKQHYEIENGKQFIIRKALKGDTTDNIGGVKGIRKDRIKHVIDAVGPEMNIENAKMILKEDEYEIFERNMRLMYLETINDNPDEQKWYEEQLLKTPQLSRENFRALLVKLEFWSVLKKIDEWFNKFSNVKDVDLFVTPNLFKFYEDNVKD